MKVLGIDPRAFADDKLVPRSPLPHVSRGALRRVKDRIEPHEWCHLCGAEVELIENRHIYGRNYGDWPYAYRCIGCDAYCGLHPNTDLPLGTLADSFTRDARKVAKIPFMTIVRTRFKGDRNRAYVWLSQVAGIPKEQCHFAMMDEETAIRVMNLCYDEVFNL